MERKGFSNVSGIILILIVLTGIVWYFTTYQNDKVEPASSIPSISGDKKSIVADGKSILEIDNEEIFNWFKTESQLCNESNINRTPDSTAFCTNKEVFKKMTSFSTATSSPDNMKIGFTIESEVLTPDKVVGIYHRTNKKVSMLTNYYLGNEFLGFSPSGTNFAYQTGCFEGLCGFIIKDSETLADKANINNPEYADERGENAIFIKWISDNQVEYKQGTELKQKSF